MKPFHMNDEENTYNTCMKRKRIAHDAWAAWCMLFLLFFWRAFVSFHCIHYGRLQQQQQNEENKSHRMAIAVDIWYIPKQRPVSFGVICDTDRDHCHFCIHDDQWPVSMQTALLKVSLTCNLTLWFVLLFFIQWWRSARLSTHLNHLIVRCTYQSKHNVLVSHKIANNSNWNIYRV